MGYTDAPDGWWQEFVAALPARTAKLAVVRADGSPHVAPVWVDLDGDEIVFMTSADTIKGKAILRDGRVALCFDDERPPFSFVTVAGTTTTSTDPDELLEWGTRIGGPVHGRRAGRGLSAAATPCRPRWWCGSPPPRSPPRWTSPTEAQGWSRLRRRGGAD